MVMGRGQKFGGLHKWTVWGVLRKLGGEDVETFTKDTFEFRKDRIVDGDEGAGVGVMGMGGLRRPHGIRKEGMEELFHNKG